MHVIHLIHYFNTVDTDILKYLFGLACKTFSCRVGPLFKNNGFFSLSNFPIPCDLTSSRIVFLQVTTQNRLFFVSYLSAILNIFGLVPVGKGRREIVG